MKDENLAYRHKAIRWTSITGVALTFPFSLWLGILAVVVAVIVWRKYQVQPRLKLAPAGLYLVPGDR